MQFVTVQIVAIFLIISVTCQHFENGLSPHFQIVSPVALGPGRVPDFIGILPIFWCNFNIIHLQIFTKLSKNQVKHLKDSMFWSDKEGKWVNNNKYSTANNNLKLRLVLSCARKYSKIMHSSALASTSAYCSQELKRNSKVVY